MEIKVMTMAELLSTEEALTAEEKAMLDRADKLTRSLHEAHKEDPAAMRGACLGALANATIERDKAAGLGSRASRAKLLEEVGHAFDSAVKFRSKFALTNAITSALADLLGGISKPEEKSL